MRVLITGASSGLGEAMARSFVERGDQVVLLARRTDRLQALKKELGERATIYTADVRDQSRVKKVIEQVEAEGAIDILINNAGVALENRPAHELDFEKWESIVQTNIMALIHLTHTVLPFMQKRKAGHIINIGSVAARLALETMPIYCSTKAFVHHFSHSLKNHLKGSGIKVTTIAPGVTRTEYAEVRSGDKKKAEAFFKERPTLEAEDVARAVLWVTEQPAHVDVTLLEIMPVS